jgi:hypothetical protein
MKATTRIALDWAIRCFGRAHVFDRPIRSLRLAEEVIELAQAYQVPKEKLLLLVETVYSRPPGDPYQELGGVMMTATVLAASEGNDPDYYLEAELRRVLSKPDKWFAERNQEKLDLGLAITSIEETDGH